MPTNSIMQRIIKDEHVYSGEESADEFYYRFNASRLIQTLIHPYCTLCFTLPITCIILFYAMPSLIQSPHSLLLSAAIYGPCLIVAGVVMILSLCQLYLHFATTAARQEQRWREWNREIAVITGGSSGIGLQLADRLSNLGVKVVILDIQTPLKPIDNAKFYQCDVSQYDQVSDVVQRVEQEIGEITILVNNAGIVNGKPIEDLDPQRIQKVFAVNTLAQFWTVKAVLPLFKRRRYGHIMTIASTMGLTAVADMTDYCSSKFAVVGFHEALRQEIRKLPYEHLIHTSIVCPGLILTGMFNGIRMGFPFIVPPLKPSMVVDEIVRCLSDVVRVPSNDGNEQVSPVEVLAIEKKFTFSDRLKQHKASWIPLTYYLPPLLNIIAPVYLNDLVKSVLGGNDAVTSSFKGRGEIANPTKL
ncbi:hypothetical protein MP228_011181 [Amoeboaphelidium protococcarum]|nr:hypothetical protein MP228_011181 [Amoeboaphelidium protococcarum]